MNFSQNKKSFLLLGVIAALGGGYYFFVLAPANSTLESLDPALSAELQAKTEKFIAHSALLQSLDIDVSVANESALLNLRSYQTTVPEQPVGKSNVFDDTVTGSGLR